VALSPRGRCLRDAQPDGDAKLSFLIFYLHPARSVKEAAFAQGITRDAFYKRVRHFRRRAYRAMLTLEAAQDTGWAEESPCALSDARA
jgi:hypothetical protein